MRGDPLNLIRLTPAKGLDTMQTSLFLAKIIGPTFAVIGASILLNARGFQEIAAEFMRNPALVFLVGHIALPAGIATVLVHNVWVAGWPVIITIFGWLAIVGGALRILAPQRATNAGRKLLDKPHVLTIAGAFWLIIGAILCFFGYF